MDVEGRVKINNSDNAVSPTNGGAFTVVGGGAIGKDFYIGGDMYCNNYLAAYVNEDMGVFLNQVDGIIGIGGSAIDDSVIFNTTKPATGEGGDDVDGADAGVVIEGGLVVRDKVIAKEFVGDGLGAGPGSIVIWGGPIPNIPDKFLLCDGASYSRTAEDGLYAKLFEAIGYTHGGSGDTFNVPDLRERFVAGAGGDNPAVAGGSYAIADVGGLNTVALTEAELPTHAHSIDSVSIPHSHNANTSIDSSDASHGHNGNANGGDHSHGGNTDGNGGHSHTGGTNSNGGHTHNYSGVKNNTVEFGNRSQRAAESGTEGRTTESAGDHSHTFATNNNGNHSHSFNTNNNSHGHGITVNSNNANHSHNSNTSVDQESPTHNHTIGNVGSNVAHENRPPYMALCYIIQIK